MTTLQKPISKKRLSGNCSTGDSAATTRQKLKAAAAVFANEVLDAGVLNFVRRFLGSLCVNAEIATDYKVEAAALLRRYEAPRVTPESVRPSYRQDGTEAARRESWRTYQRWQLRKQIVLTTRKPPPPGYDAHLIGDTYQPPEGNDMPPVRVVTDPVSGYRLLDDLMPGFRQRRGNGNN